MKGSQPNLLLPKSVRPPYQAVVIFPAVDALFFRTSADIAFAGYTGYFTNFLAKTGRVVVYPIYAGTYERRVAGQFSPPAAPTNAYRDEVMKWSKDLGRTMDYLETRSDIDQGRIAYFGLSWGATIGPVMLAVEPRFRAAILCYGGFHPGPLLPEVDGINFAPRVKFPVLMINGRQDHRYPVETLQDPMYRWLGTGSVKKEHVLHEGGHTIGLPRVIEATLDWLDRHLGPVR